VPTERWDDNRLDRLATQVDRNTANIADLTTSIGALIKVADVQHQDMRGLQLEVRRLVEEMRQDREG
jgi:hypothetical protein